MKKFKSLLRQIHLAILCLVISSFILNNACAWPWPRITVNTDELGYGKIADFLKNAGWSNDENRIANIVKEMLSIENNSQSPRASAESIGMHCARLPSKTCVYHGKVKFQFHGTSPENPDAGKPRYAIIEIVLPNHDDPNSLFVNKTEALLP